MGMMPLRKRKKKEITSAFDDSDDAVMIWMLQQAREKGLTAKEISQYAEAKGLAIPRAQRALDRLEKRGRAVWHPGKSSGAGVFMGVLPG